jgi:hypothetical protein
MQTAFVITLMVAAAPKLMSVLSAYQIFHFVAQLTHVCKHFCKLTYMPFDKLAKYNVSTDHAAFHAYVNRLVFIRAIKTQIPLLSLSAFFVDDEYTREREETPPGNP